MGDKRENGQKGSKPVPTTSAPIYPHHKPPPCPQASCTANVAYPPSSLSPQSWNNNRMSQKVSPFGAGELVQSVNCYVSRGSEFGPQNPCKLSEHAGVCCNLMTETAGSLGLAYHEASLTELVSWDNERAFLKKRGAE